MNTAVEVDNLDPTLSGERELRAFLIADVRGYTSFTAEHGDQAAARLAMKFATIAREMVAMRDGQVIELRGDEALAVFPSARQALYAAAELQVRFGEEMNTDPSLPLKVGIGVDAGEAVPVEGGYRGLALNMAARLCSLAKAGEVYGTEGVVDLAQKLDGYVYVERGRVMLKGIEDPVRVIQVLPEADLPAGFPPLVSLVAKPSNLPLQPTPFIGREREVEEISRMLSRDDVRLLTLTGPGGTGKTRLALQVGSAVLDQFERGAFLVSLASISDPDLILSTIARTLKVKEVAGQSLIDTVKDYLRDRQMLLVLDNFEHLLDGASIVAEIIADCKSLKILVTSRSVLHLSAEYDYAVPPLMVPDLKHLPGPDDLLSFDAVALFVQRAGAARADFSLSAENARPVAEICTSVDGLPLAIELAAARVKVFPPRMLLTRLSHRLGLLTGGARDLPSRQQTLRATIDWSFSLLDEEEQRLFARLSVFAGGCRPDAAEHVCADIDWAEPAVLDGMRSLTEKSLLRQDGAEEPRFRMLETIREYALGRLESSGNASLVRRRHCGHYLAVAEQAQPAFHAPDQGVWLDRLETEHDNMRAALGWAIQEKEDELALRFGSALHWFWQVRGHVTEGRRWLEQSLSLAGAVRTPVQVEALHGAGWLAIDQGDLVQAQSFLEEALALARDLGEEAGVAESLTALGKVAILRGDYERARTLCEESLDLYLNLNDMWGVAAVTNDLGLMALGLGDYNQAKALLEEALSLARHLGQRRGVAIQLLNLGYVAWYQGDFEQARGLYQESLDVSRDVGEKLVIATSLNELGMVTQFLGDEERAAHYSNESLQLFRELDHPLGYAEWLENQARVAAFQGYPTPAARLHGAAHALRESIGAPLSSSDRAVHDRDLAAARAALGDNWLTAWKLGATMSAEQAIEYASVVGFSS